MKKTILTIILILAYFVNFSQSSIKIFTELEEETAQFMVWINEEPQDAYPSDEVIVEGLLPGKFTIQVSFNADSIADWTKTIKLKKNETVVYKVVQMKQISKSVGELGRNIKENSGEDYTDGGLMQYYRLEKQKE